jgi:hypothetical protein
MRLKLSGESWLGKRLARTPSQPGYESEGSMPVLPFEAVLVAALNFGSKLIELMIADRQGMTDENRAEFDKIRIAGLARIERILSMVESIGTKGIQQ